MSDEHLDDIDLETSKEYEEITSDEVDSVVEKLEELAECVSSQNIKAYLDLACQQIYCLVYEDEEEEEEVEEVASDEADDDEELLNSDLDSKDEDDEDFAAEAAEAA